MSCLQQERRSEAAPCSTAEAALDNHMAACRKQLTAAPSSAIYTSQSGKHIHTLGRFYASQSPVLVSNVLGCRCWQRALSVSGVPPAGGLAASHRWGASGRGPARGVSGCRATHTGAQRCKADRGGVAGGQRGLQDSKGTERKSRPWRMGMRSLVHIVFHLLKHPCLWTVQHAPQHGFTLQ